MKKSLICILLITAGTAGAAHRWNFDGLVNGNLPEGWTVESTGGNVPLGVWHSAQDTSSPAGRAGILRLADTGHNMNQGFNICWTDTISLQ